MKRTFTLQIRPRPDGAVFQCKQCGFAGMHGEALGDIQPICPYCSPFLKVSMDASSTDGLLVVCRHATQESPSFNRVRTFEKWAETHGQKFPDEVVDAVTRFLKSTGRSLRITPIPKRRKPEDYILQGHNMDIHVRKDPLVGVVIDPAPIGGIARIKLP